MLQVKTSLEHRFGVVSSNSPKLFWRNLQRHSLSEHYTKDPDYAPKMRCFPALAFVPLHEVTHYFETLEQSFTKESEMSFIDYFEETWIGRARIRNMRGRPKFVECSGASGSRAASADKWLS